MMIRLEHYATALSITGAILLAVGWPSLMVASLVIQIAGGILWCVYSVQSHQRPLLLVNCAFIAVELIGVYNWM